MDYGKIVALNTSARLKETLEGDVISVKTKEAAKLSSIVAGTTGLLRSNVVGDALELTVRGGEALLPRIVEAAAKNGIFVESVSLREPNLADVFLHYTGREIRSEGGTDELHGMAAIRRRSIR
jgi:ABC-2 type transport system ATP-binding protein